ncbi:MAG: hypothetical protein IJI84_06650, partial [Clostridia bacterium]|nr:hypothetical protein [Clostridia bacterium]
RSSFKRTVNGWKSDYNKLKKIDDTDTKKFKLEKELQDIIEKLESEESKERKKLEKEKEKLRKEIEKLAKQANVGNSLFNKLKEKMKKEAEKYLANKKNYLNENKISVTKDPKHSPALLDYKEKINNVNKCFSEIYNAVNKKVWPICENAYKHYRTFDTPDINFTIEKIKKPRIVPDIDHIKKLLQDNTNKFKKDFASKFTENPGFLHFVSCYVFLDSLHACKGKKFSDWFETEYSYLKRFKDLTDKEMLAYRKHGPFLEHTGFTGIIGRESENLYNALIDLYDFCKKHKTKNTLKYYAKRALGAYMVCDNIGAIAISVLSSSIPLQLIIILWTMFNPGFKLLNTKRKSLYEDITNTVKKINEEIDELVDYKPGKNDLNLEKVKYMHEVLNELNKE